MNLEPHGQLTLEQLLSGAVRKDNFWAALPATTMMSEAFSWPRDSVVITKARWLGYPTRFQVRNFAGFWNDKKFPEYPGEKTSYAWFISEHAAKAFGMKWRLASETTTTNVVYHPSLI